MHKKILIRNLLLIILVFICLYSLVNFVDNKIYKGKIINKNDVVLVSDNSNRFMLKDNYPMLDEVGRKITYSEENSHVQIYYEFEVKSKSNTDTNYEIYLSSDKYKNNIHPNFIKIYLTDSNNNPIEGFNTIAVPTYFNLKVATATPLGRRLYYGKIKANDTKKYILRAWIGDAYAVGVDSKEFGFDLYVEAVE